jgi:cytoskeletal protein CcmA (bactofilin family)
MSAQLGRISGPLLKSDLLRNNVDLAFETDLLYLDVDPGRIGINTTSPQYDLDVNGTTRTTNLLVDTRADISEFTLTGNTISSSNNIINLIPDNGQAVIYNSSVEISDTIRISGNAISTIGTNVDLEIRPNGTGQLFIDGITNISGNLNVTGNITATGDVNIGGNIVIGDELTDTITINASIQSDLIPESDAVYDLGSPTNYWKDIYVQNFVTNNLSVTELEIGDLVIRNNEITSTAGQDIIMYGNGSGGVQLGNFKFSGNTLTNVSNNAISQITSTGTGYFKIDGTNGFVPPRGTTAERPTAYAVLGMTRYNTETRALEVWDGFTWANPAGTLGAISEAQANDIAVAYAIMLG